MSQGGRRHNLNLLLPVLLLLTVIAAPAAAQAQGITLEVEAGFDSFFREHKWFPIRVQASNAGADRSGRLVLRPETSGNAFSNTFSTALELPAGARKRVFLYATARSFADSVRIEYLDDDNIVLASQEAPLRHVPEADNLHVLAGDSSRGRVDLSSLAPGGRQAWRAGMALEDLPPLAAALQSVDTFFFSDVDSGALDNAQREALAARVLAGAHLIVTGGAGWQGTAAGLGELLPLGPSASLTTADLASLAALAGSDDLPPGRETLIATGSLRADARVLATTPDGVPLLLRREYGLGTVDYLAADPLVAPLSEWPGLDNLWFTLAATRRPLPGWSQGITDLERAANASEILPGLDLLPDLLPLCGFLLLYVALIGPLNYLILRRINRRAWAWVTIPALILLFSALSWSVGFGLRGTSATLSRLALVQAWPESEQAQVTGLVGVLSPRRATYNLLTAPGSSLRPLAREIPANPFAAGIQARTDIRQADSFDALDFNVDASFISTFHTTAVTPAPAITGAATLSYRRGEPDPLTGEPRWHWLLSGTVRNAGDFPLSEPVILARAGSQALPTALQPGESASFELPLVSDTLQPPAPSPLERRGEAQLTQLRFSRFSRVLAAREQSVMDIMQDDYNTRAYREGPGSSATAQERHRRQLLLSAAVTDPFLSTARGGQVFLAGWGAMPLQTEPGEAQWEPNDAALYLIALEVEQELPQGLVRIEADQFTWVAQERNSLSGNAAPVNTDFQPGDQVVFRFTPLPLAQLERVEALQVIINLRNTGPDEIPLDLWDWRDSRWRPVTLSRPRTRSTTRTVVVENPQALLGAQNSVLLRLVAEELGSALRVERLAIEQQGYFMYTDDRATVADA
ncbi:MAG: hypothetical protein OXP68_13080 [Anaerolineaceae bacterium]|nr:hypothetical protein [Anaerolineaceae bacterium]